jgi:glutamate-1-semialdehyde 2,1-aminomutase
MISLDVDRSAPSANELFAAAKEVLPGGVSAAARIHASIGRPFFASRGMGSRVWDLDGREYIDLNMSFGAALLGHGNPVIRRAIESALDVGVLCAFETPFQTEVARKLTELVPCAELVRFTQSGTETTWHAVRTARAYTGRSKVIKFEGHFHGFNDTLGFSMWPPVAEAGAEDAPLAIAASGGMPPDAAGQILVLPWNDARVLEQCLEAHRGEVAAVIMEPIGYNAGTILPAPGYLEAVRTLTRDHGVVLIFDEILSGFRTGPGGAQAYLGVTPDMCTLGKCLGAGTALSAFAGSREVMSAVAPLGTAVHSGTFNAHTIPIFAANAFLDEIVNPGFWSELRRKEEAFYPALRTAFSRAGLPVWVQAVGARFSLHFGLTEEPRSYRDAEQGDRAMATAFYRAALANGVYFHHARHHGFSTMHTDADLAQAVEAIEAAARAVTAD